MTNTTNVTQNPPKMLNPRELGDLVQLHADTVRKAAPPSKILNQESFSNATDHH
jgi:hypothetical protein